MTRDELLDQFQHVRSVTEQICEPLEAEDHVPQPIEDVSPPKWHLGHVSWFFETLLLAEYVEGYRAHDPDLAWQLNSYYENLGDRIARPLRGTLSRPTVRQIEAYRRHVTGAMGELIESVADADWATVRDLVILGLHHEQQHQELLLTDVKYILACNPTWPAYRAPASGRPVVEPGDLRFVAIDGGQHEIGHAGDGFHYDNEGPRHRVFVDDFEIGQRLVTNCEYLAFVEDGGYQRFDPWLSDAWTTVREQGWDAPLYWRQIDGVWHEFTLEGLLPLNPAAPVTHISYYEAEAYAFWSGHRLPTEAEWELASRRDDLCANRGSFYDDGALHPQPARPVEGDTLQQMYGDCWEWTASAYLPYPGYRRFEGPLGEYNGKFMVNQMVLRGGSCATSLDHIRPTYRNFFKCDRRWQFKGLRLAR